MGRRGRGARTGDLSHEATERILHAYVSVRRRLLCGARRVLDGLRTGLRIVRVDGAEVLLLELRFLSRRLGSRCGDHGSEHLLPAVGQCHVYMSFNRGWECESQVLRSVTGPHVTCARSWRRCDNADDHPGPITSRVLKKPARGGEPPSRQAAK